LALTDNFAHRYANLVIWDEYTEEVRRLLHQSIGILKDLFPYHKPDGKLDESQKATWKQLHDSMSRELGVKELSPVWYSYQQAGSGGHSYTHAGSYNWDKVCETYMTQPFAGRQNPDRFIKERLSLVEVGLRYRAQQIAVEIALSKGPFTVAGARAAGTLSQGRLQSLIFSGTQTKTDIKNFTFTWHVEEFNERLRRAGAPLSYHNGFIQLTDDQKIEVEIAKPFWAIVSDSMWKNVSIDMAEALDHRDNGGKDPALYAAKALESAIKIISDVKGLTTGNEKGAANYIDNLVSQKNGRFIDVWESVLLKEYFSKVRNTVSHGAGSEPMPTFSLEQTNWVIESAMSWVRSLIKRM